MGYFSDAYRDFKWFEKMQKEANVGKRDFKQIEKIHKKNKKKKKQENDMGDYIAELLNRLIIVIPALLLGICIGKRGE